jgi:hypothetical protein
MLKRFTPIAIILLWIVPVGWVGLMRSDYPLYPSWLASLFRVSGVFETAPSRWRIFFIEAQNDAGWHQVDEKLLFASTPLGDRTRFQQLMNEIMDAHPKQASDILAWISQRLNETSRFGPTLKSVRIIQFSVPSETFLRCASLAEVYPEANATRLPRQIIATLAFHETH